MKKILLKTINIIISWLQHYYDKHNSNDNLLVNYNFLSPTNDAKDIDHYIESIDWALKCSNRIKNIALAGPLGSGKSSVINTFQRQNTNKNYRFLNISLATFEPKQDLDTEQKNDYLRLIELSILQQLFYHEEDRKIPDSRFKKIKNNKKWYLLILTIGFLIFLYSVINLIFPYFFTNQLSLNLNNNTINILKYVSFIITTLGLSFIFFKSIRVINGLAFKKLSIYNAEIEIDENVSKSILNHHIDEILYFFEATKYNIVIIEDLDRFEQTEVFTKLREINLLINNSKKIKRDIVFIYAIRDDIFTNNNRTKFFDFIIPIIPVVNSSNSNEIILDITKRNKYQITGELIDNISFFIDDMRLLLNIINEYNLYTNCFAKNLNQDKLLSLLVYKNLHPKDFSNLINNEGILYNTISKKHEYLNKETERIKSNISEKEEKIKHIEEHKIKDIKELRVLYLANIISRINISGEAFNSFFIEQRGYKIQQATDDEIFHFFLENDTIHYIYGNSNNQRRRFNLDFRKIENEVDSNYTYIEREEMIVDSENGKVELLKKEIEELVEEQNNVNKLTIRDLISNNNFDFDIGNEKHEQLINILLRNDYVSEDYLDYISIFYEGRLSKTDYQYLINIKTQKTTSFDYKLKNLENLIKKINLYDFDREFTLNYNILDFFITGNKQIRKKKRFFDQLKNEKNSTTNFIDNYLNQTANKEAFIELLCKYWINIWNWISEESSFTKEKKLIYYNLIIKHAHTDDIKLIFNKNKSHISNDKQFLNRSKEISKLKEIISSLDVKFIDIDDSSPKNLLDFVYDGNFYDINIKMLIVILKSQKVFNKDEFMKGNYSAIKNSELQNMNSYIDDNLDIYISSVFLKLKNNSEEQEQYIAILLNSKKLTIENKTSIIKSTNTRIADIEIIKEIIVINVLLTNSKVLSTWENIITAYVMNNQEFSTELIDFLNIISNSSQLSSDEFNTEIYQEEINEQFVRTLLSINSLNDNSYSLLLKSIHYQFTSFDFGELAQDKVKQLIYNSNLSTNSTIYNTLRENYDYLHISLIEQEPENYLEEPDSFELNNDELLLLLKSSNLTILVKELIISKFDITHLEDESKILNQLGALILSNDGFNIEHSLVRVILAKCNLPIQEKIEIFNKKNESFDDDEIDDFLKSLDSPYSKIALSRKRPLIDHNKTNQDFVNILKYKGYISTFELEKKGIRVLTFWK